MHYLHVFFQGSHDNISGGGKGHVLLVASNEERGLGPVVDWIGEQVIQQLSHIMDLSREVEAVQDHDDTSACMHGAGNEVKMKLYCECGGTHE